MHKLLWLTDIHLDWLTEIVTANKGQAKEKVMSEPQVAAFCQEIMKNQPDSIVITGDISTAPAIEVHLMWLETYLPGIPIYFVLGNHDYYNGSIKEVRDRMVKYDGTKTRTQWLNVSEVVKLTEKTALVGHDGWYDGGYSDWFKSKLLMNDYYLIKDFRFKVPALQHQRMVELASECGNHIDRFVHKAASDGFKNIIFATHVPPFRENSRAPDGSLSDVDWLPNMSSKIAGSALLRAANAHPGARITCLCGHTHTRHAQQYRDNLTCLTGQANYGFPASSIQLIEVE